MGLIDRHDRAKPHGDRGQLPEVRHQPGVRVGRQTLAIDLFTVVIHLLFGQPAFKEGTRINTWRAVALDIDKVATKVAAGRPEEVVEAHFIEGGARHIAGDMAANAAVLAVGTCHHRRHVPANHGADLALHEEVTGHGCLAVDRNGVAMRRSD